MKLILQDRDEAFEKDLQQIYDAKADVVKIITDDGKINPCIGCFGCWIKTPTTCVIHDGYEHISADILKSEELIIINKGAYGTYSPFIRNLLDRNLSFVLPDFTKRNREIHHKLRYDKQPVFTVYFYGDMTDKERQTAGKTVYANAINLNGVVNKIAFLSDENAVLDAIKNSRVAV